MKPSEHPDFYRLAPPPGSSRESTIVLDAEGRFWHDGGLVDHSALSRALHQWIDVHPENGRFILTNGYDWTYFRVEDAPYVVRRVRFESDSPIIVLSDESEEPLSPEQLRVGRGDVLYTKVKHGRFDARFSRHAQLALAPLLREDQEGAITLRVGGRDFALRPDQNL